MVERGTTALVGREASLDVLRRAVQRARGGAPSVLLVTGETGVGKTRLVRELVALEQPVLLGGSCVPMAGDPLPFGPLTQALRRLGPHPAVRAAAAQAPELRLLLPASVRQAIGLDPSRVPSDQLGPGAQLGLFQAVLELLTRLGAPRPVLHVVEDLHWADRSTLDLLRYLTTNLTHEPVVVLATYRAEDVPPSAPLSSWLAEVGLLEITERVTLDRLGEADADSLVRELLGADAAPDVVARILARSAGNPLFVEHLVHGGESGALPDTLDSVLAARVVALPGATREVLAGLAVLGRAVRIDVLARTVGVPVGRLEAGLRPALDARVVDVREDTRIGFHHPAFGEVVLGRLLPTERSRLHRAAALAIEREAPDHASYAGELARHWLQAGDPARALPAAAAAGQAAEAMFAFAAARDSYTQAAELASRLPSDHDPVELLARAAECASLIGETENAIALARSALEGCDRPPLRAALCERLGAYHYLAGRADESHQWFRAALDELDGPQRTDQPTEVALRAIAGLALLAAAWTRLDEAEAWCDRGFALAEQLVAPSEVGRLHNALGLVGAGRGELDDGIRHLREALRIASHGPAPSAVATAYVNLSHVLGLAGRTDELVALCDEGTAELGRLGLARQPGSLLQANTAEALAEAGRLAEAERLVRTAEARHPRGITLGPVLAQSARIALYRGDLLAAWDRVERARLVLESGNAPMGWLREVAQLAAEVELWAGRPAAALALVVDGLRLVRGTDEERSAGILLALGYRALADESETGRDAATRHRLDEAARELDAIADEMRPRTPNEALSAWLTAETARFHGRRAPDVWAAATAAWDRLGFRFRAAYARWRDAEARLDRGADGAAVTALRRAHDEARSIGAGRLADELERLARWHRIDLPGLATLPDDGAPESAAGGVAARLDTYGLTAREREVLAGLAAGRTNRELAQELYISIKTASVHVSNILRKLDVTSRQEAARIAHRVGVRD